MATVWWTPSDGRRSSSCCISLLCQCHRYELAGNRRNDFRYVEVRTKLPIYVCRLSKLAVSTGCTCDLTLSDKQIPFDAFKLPPIHLTSLLAKSKVVAVAGLSTFCGLLSRHSDANMLKPRQNPSRTTTSPILMTPD